MSRKSWKRGGVWLLAVTGGLALTSCASAPVEGTAADPASDFTACAMSGAGGWQDKSFNEQVYTGLTNSGEQLGIEVMPFESATSDDFKPGLESLIDQGCNLIFSVGFEANDAVNDAAAANPDIDFVTVDGYVKDESTTNLKAVAYLMDQSSYLGGYLAAAQSKTHVIGTFGAIQNAAITDFMTGYYYGAKQWAEDNATPTEVVGWNPENETGVFVGNFEDQVAAKTIAANQLDQGADVLFPVAGPLFAAAAEAISESGAEASFMGVDSDVALTNPQYAALTLTSVEKRMTKAVEAIIEGAANGEFDASPYLGDLENEGTGLAPFYEFEDSVSAELQAKLDEITAAIIAGDVATKG